VRTDSLFSQQGSREVVLAPSRQFVCIDDRIGARHPSFDSVMIGLHWATVLLLVAVSATAWLHALAEARQSDLTTVLLQVHRSIGVTIWIITAFRLAWRLTGANLPPFPAAMTGPHRAVVKASEYGLYALLLAQPVTGLLTTFSGGRPFALFAWQFAPLMARNEMLQGAFHRVHELGAWALAALALGHAAAALFHHVVLRDDVLARMAPVMQRRVTRDLAGAALFQPEHSAGNKQETLPVLLTGGENAAMSVNRHPVPANSGGSPSSH